MAEKNTLSILESIKKKMQRLDQKGATAPEPQANISASKEDEFEYIGSEKKRHEEIKKEPVIQPKILPKFEDDLGLDEDFSSKKLEVKTEDTKNLNSSTPIVEAASQTTDKKEEPVKKPENEQSLSAPIATENKITESKTVSSAVNNPEKNKPSSQSPVTQPPIVPNFGKNSYISQQPNSYSENKAQPTAATPPTINPSEEEFKASVQYTEDSLAQAEASAIPIIEEATSPQKNLSTENNSAKTETAPTPQSLATEESTASQKDNVDDINLDDFDKNEEEDLLEVPAKNLDEEEKDEHEEDEDFDEEFTLDDDEDEDEEHKFEDDEEDEEELENSATAEEKNDSVKDDISSRKEVFQSNFLPEKKIENSFEEDDEPLETAPQKDSQQDHKIDESDLTELLTSHHLPQENEEEEDEKSSTQNSQDEDYQMSLNEEVTRSASESIKKLLIAKNAAKKADEITSHDTLLEKIAIELMKPALESWLNENLPSLVEEIVRDEIEKIVGSSDENKNR